MLWRYAFTDFLLVGEGWTTLICSGVFQHVLR